MFSGAKRYVKLITLLLRHGHLEFRGIDFNELRREGVKPLLPLLLNYRPPTSENPARSFVLSKAWSKNLLGQAAFIKTNLKQRGKHFYAPALNLCYIRNYKVASTALSRAMIENVEPLLKGHPLSPTQINFLADIHVQQAIPADNNVKFFSVVRNPFHRIVSAYRYFFETSDPFNFEDYLFGIFDKQLSFPEFVKRLHAIPDRLKDDHFRSQQQLFQFYERAGITIDIFKLEHPQFLEQFLTQYQIFLPVVNSSAEAYDYRTYYDDASFDVVAEMYREDITRFGYQEDMKDLHHYILKRRQ